MCKRCVILYIREPPYISSQQQRFPSVGLGCKAPRSAGGFLLGVIMKQCIECDKKYHAKGLCRKHYDAKYHSDNPTYHTGKHLMRKYGITIEQYDRMSMDQNNVCRICSQPQTDYKLAVDHDHKTGEIRGLLCQNCNTGLGKFQDNIQLLQNAIDYLARS